MATVPKEVDRFLGLNKDNSGDTQLQLGEASFQKNFRITDSFKLKKINGYKELFATLGAFNIRGMWRGKISGAYHFLFAANGHLYEHNLTTGVNTDLGALSADAPTNFFAFNDKVYIQTGSEYQSWDGTTLANVVGYRPKVAIGTPPSGGIGPEANQGKEYEGINLLNGMKHQTFSPDGTATEYVLMEKGLTSVDFVYVDGVLKTVATDYTVDLVNGKVTFTLAPTGGVPDSVDIGWTKGTGSRSEVFSHRFSMFYGGKNDSRIFLYGNGTNRYIYSGLANGVPSAEYFPVFNRRDIGSDEFAVTDIVRQYDRQVIYTDGGEAQYSYYDSFIDALGNTIVDFPTFPLNQTKGNVAPGQVQVLNNNPFSIYEGVYEWVATSVRDERNANYVSKRVQPDLDILDLSTALTYDFEELSEYWLCVGNKVWVYNYRIDVWYYFELYDTPTCFLTINKELYFGTSKGQIMKFEDDLRSFNGQSIPSRWEMGNYDWDLEFIRKFLNRVWISLQAGSKVGLNVSWETEKNASTQALPIGYNLFDLKLLDFEDFSFETNYSIQPFRLKIKAKKFAYFKLILENNSATETVTVLSIILLGRLGGQVK